MNAVVLMATPCPKSLHGKGRSGSRNILQGLDSWEPVDPVRDDDDVHYYVRWRLKLEGETENTGVCTKERKGVAAEVLCGLGYPLWPTLSVFFVHFCPLVIHKPFLLTS